MAKKGYIKFALKGNKKPIAYQIPLKGMMLEKKDKEGRSLGLKNVQYIPGAPSIFTEDYKGDEKPKDVWLEDGSIEVSEKNVILLEILNRHPWNGSHFERVDEDAKATKELANMELVELALKKVDISDDDELKATAVVIIGPNIIPMTPVQVRARLKQRAFEAPKELLDVMKNPNYQARYVASLAILRGILVVNPTRTAVSWPNGGVLVTVAAGQDPVEKLANFLSGNNEVAKVTLQEIGEKSKRSYVKKSPPVIEEEIEKLDPIEENDLSSQGEDETPPPTDDPGDNDITDDQAPAMTLEEATAAYVAKHNKQVSNNKKNDLAWIMSKL